MKVIKSLLLYCLAMAVGAASVACHHDDSDIDVPCDEITIVNDWDDASGACPEGMAYMFFPKGCDDAWRFDFPGRNAGEVELPDGEYRFIMFNDDTSVIDFLTYDGGEVYATTSECGLNTLNDSTYYEGESVHKAPDMLWCYSIDLINIHGSHVDYDGIKNPDRFIITHPRQVTPCHSLTVRHVTNLHGVVWIAGAITGQAESIDLNNYSHCNPPVTVPFKVEIGRDSTLTARFVTFGVPDNTDVVNNVDIFFLLSDGKMVKTVVDVTDRIKNAPDPMNIDFVVDLIELPWAPPAEIGGGGFLPTVNGWVDVVINYDPN